MKQGDKDRTSRSPTLSSFFRFNTLLPKLRRDDNPQRGHQTHLPPHYRDGSPSKHRAKRRDRYREEDRSKEPVKITLQDLDHLHGPYYLLVKRGIEVVRLKKWVKERCRISDRLPSDSVGVRFFADARELSSHDFVGSHPLVWFRLVTPRDKDTWRFTDLRDGTDGRLDAAFADQMTRCIESGSTVGQLRRLIAKHMGIRDSHRVILVARDGVRVGSLQGDMWEVRQARSWFCRWISIDVSSPRSYVILDGPWGQYLFHPSKESHSSGVVAKDVKIWLEMCLLKNVDLLHNSKLRVKWSLITLTSSAGRLSDDAAVNPGDKVGFELPWYLEDVLAAEESWLLQSSETCTVCTDNKKPTELPVQIACACKHKPTTCRECLGQWIHSSLDSLTWDRLKCPECPELLKFNDVRRYAPKHDFDRYDTLATRAALRSIPNFRWCLSTSCESGQIHDPACRKFKCAACKVKHCVYHDMPWHSGETCEQYDHRNRRRRKDEKASEEMIKRTTKVCPDCTKSVHKWTGCNHITCVCGHEWCYICLAPFRRNQHGFLYCRHNAGCSETDPFADLIDPEGQPRIPDRIRNEENRPRAFRPPGFIEPRPPVHQHGPAPDDLMRHIEWLGRLDEGLLVAVGLELEPARGNDDEGRPQPRRLRLEDLLEENFDRGGVERAMDHAHIARPGNQPRQQDHVNAWVRAWMRMEHDGAEMAAMIAGMAQNRPLPRPLNLATHFEANE